MPELQEPLPGDSVDATWGDQVSNRVVSRYATEASRDSGGPHEEGSVCYVLDVDLFQYFDGSVWHTVDTPGQSFKGISTSIALGDQTIALNTTEQLGSSLSLGIPNVPVRVTAAVSGSTLAAAGADSNHRVGIEISFDNGGSWDVGPFPYGMTDGTVRRQMFGTVFGSDGGVSSITSNVLVRVMARSNGGPGATEFENGFLIATMMPRDGLG